MVAYRLFFQRDEYLSRQIVLSVEVAAQDLCVGAKGDAVRRLVIAFCVAPVLPVVVKTWPIGQSSEGISFVLLVIIGGTAYGMQLLAGVPLYLLLRRYQQNDLVAYFLAGFFTVLIAITVLTVCLSGFSISLLLRSSVDSA